MTAPAQPGSHSVSVDDIEAQLTQPPAPPKAADIKLDGADVPEAYRGKSLADLLDMQARLEQSLRVSEQGRMLATQQAERAAATPPPPPAPTEPAELTNEQLAELHSTDPLAAIQYMNERAVKNAMRNFETRLAPMMQGTTSVAEQGARAKYADVFEALGQEISQVVQSLPDKTVLSNPQAWDQLIGYVRGQSGNFEKMMQYKINKDMASRQTEAQRAQAASAGLAFAPTPTSAPRAAGAGGELDEYTKEIAKNLNMSPEEYIKWRDIA